MAQKRRSSGTATSVRGDSHEEVGEEHEEDGGLHQQLKAREAGLEAIVDEQDPDCLQQTYSGQNMEPARMFNSRY
jgi:hypothetical protein